MTTEEMLLKIKWTLQISMNYPDEHVLCYVAYHENTKLSKETRTAYKDGKPLAAEVTYHINDEKDKRLTSIRELALAVEKECVKS